MLALAAAVLSASTTAQGWCVVGYVNVFLHPGWNLITNPLDYDCTGTNDSMDVYLRVDQPGGDACIPYTVSYHF